MSFYSDSKPIILMTSLVRAVLPQTPSPAGADSDDDGFRDSVEELESFTSATSFAFQPSSTGIVIAASEAAVLLQACHSLFFLYSSRPIFQLNLDR
jgi:hypothetical protein